MSSEAYDPVNEEIYQHPIIQRHSDLLEQLRRDRIFDIYAIDGRFYISEMCDGYFERKLTRADCLELSEIFREIADEIKD